MWSEWQRAIWDIRPLHTIASDGLSRTASKKPSDRVFRQLPGNAIVKIGNPAQEIIATAAELGVDLVVMAIHGRAGVPGWL